MQNGTENAYRRLAVAIVLQAIRDIHEANGRAVEAEEWLLCDETKNFLDCLNLDINRIENAICFTKKLRDENIRVNFRSMEKIIMTNYYDNGL